MRVLDVDYRGRETTSGVDSPEDVKRVEEILEKYGEFEPDGMSQEQMKEMTVAFNLPK
jgi:hypothetical protein